MPRLRIPSLPLRVQILLVIALVALPALVLLVYTGFEQRNRDARLGRAQAMHVARDVGSEYAASITNTQAFIRPIAGLLTQRGSLADIDPDGCTRFLQAYVGEETPYASVHVIQTDGTVSCASQALTAPVSFAEASVFHQALQTPEPVVGAYQVDPVTERRVLPVAQSVSSTAGEPLGVLMFMIDLVALNLADAVAPLPAGSYATVVDRNGTILARHPELDGVVGSPVRDQESFARIKASGSGTLDALNREGVQSLIAYTRLGPTDGAFILVGTPESVVYAEADSTLRRNLGLLALATLTGAAFAWIGTDQVVLRPLRRVVDVADRIEAGDSGARVGPLYGAGELGELGQAFDEMARAVEQRKAEVDELNATLEHRVEQRTEELVQANRELEAFSYSVSHDLRAPLRAIDGFSEMLQAQYQAVLPDEAQRFIQRVRSGAVRMGALIDDLLQFSRVTRTELARQPVSLDALVQETIEEIGVTDPGRAIEWRVSELGKASADAGLLRRVFANLLGNAVKFSRDRDPAVIEIGRTETDGQVTYFVRDNGVGFDMAHAGQMFGVFQRLHLQDEFEGTGIGLATVERIVHRHGGRVWAESELDEGATFYFTLGPETRRNSPR